MRKVCFCLMVVLSLVIGSFAQAGVIWENDCSSLDGWSWGSESGDGVQVINGSAIQMNSWWDGAKWTNMWRGTDAIIEVDTEYDVTFSLNSFSNGKAVKITVQSIVDGNWTTIAQESVSPIAGSYNDYALSFSTLAGENAEHVGGKFAIGIKPDWWNNMAVDHVAITPEPATLSMLGLGALAAIKRKRG